MKNIGLLILTVLIFGRFAIGAEAKITDEI